MKKLIFTFTLLTCVGFTVPAIAADNSNGANSDSSTTTKWGHKGMHKDASGNWVDANGTRYDSTGKPVTGNAARDNSAPGLADTTKNPDVEGGGPNQK